LEPARARGERPVGGQALAGHRPRGRLLVRVGGLQSRDLDLRRAVTALEELATLLEGLDREGTSAMALARGERQQEPWILYPNDYGIFDRKRHSQFYYHAHLGADHEEGHFHTVRLFPDHTVHLVAISMAPSGWPQALFTVNLWAIGDRDASP